MSNDTRPEIRFPGFTEDWEERKLIDLVVRLNKSTNSSRLPKVEFEDIVAGEGRLNKDVSQKFDNRKGIEFLPNDILYGKLRPYLKNWLKATFTGVAIGDFWVFRAKKSDSDFIYSLIQADRYQKAANDTSGTKMPRSDWKKVSDTVFYIPNDLKEQQKIGIFFKKLDDTIALHQRKLDLLKETKKGFLQKMFPENGAKVPEVRFPGFTGDWEERKLGEVVVFLNGRAFKQQELLDSGKYRVLRVGNFNTNDRWYYSNLELEEDKYANKGDLLYLWATSFGPEMWNEERVIYHYHIWKLKFLSKELDKQYLYTWLLTDKEKIKESTNGTTMVHVTKGGIEQRTFQFPPDINEQQKIGAFFKQLDDTIALHQRKLDLLKETKKGFLQKMFV
ncbi:restriction endonuclease subunit S [Enterococcus faecium]|nr:restriction endonuclease subunit S [Enterococcus faecium]